VWAWFAVGCVSDASCNVTLSAPAYDICFVIGAGVCMRSWEAVCRAVADFQREMGADCGALDRDQANYLLAQHVYEMRFGFADMSRRGDEMARKHENRRDLYLKNDSRLKELIALRLREATDRGDLALDDRFLEAVDHAFRRGSVVFFTANWDLLLERIRLRAGLAKIQHLHGSVEDYGGLYLPTETAEEVYRSVERRNSYGDLLAALWQHAGRAQRVWIYGLGLDPSDAELGRLLTAGLSVEPRVPREVVVSVPREHIETVAARAELLVKRSQQSATVIRAPVGDPPPL
jgi:hypothetical protein